MEVVDGMRSIIRHAAIASRITPYWIADEVTTDLQGAPLDNDPPFLFKTERSNQKRRDWRWRS